MTRDKLLKEINKIVMVTSSKYLDDVIKSKNNILDMFEDRTCNWKKDLYCQDNGVNAYETECNNTFEMGNDDTPDENDFKFCPYCGGGLKYAILLPDDIDKLMDD